MAHGATKRMRRLARRYDLDLRGLDRRQQRRVLRTLGRRPYPRSLLFVDDEALDRWNKIRGRNWNVWLDVRYRGVYQ